MSLFPVQADSCTFVTSAPPAEAPVRHGIRLAAAGNFTYACLAGDVNVGANGLRFDVNGAVLIVDASGGLPPGTTFNNGLPLSPLGALCIGAGASVSYNDGMPFVADGGLKGGIA